MGRFPLVLVLFTLSAGCPGPSSAPDGGASGSDGGPGDAARVPTDAGSDASPAGDAGPAVDAGPGAPIVIAEWTDAPGECPAGATRVDITTVQEMEDASRGDAHTEGTCFFVHDGVYDQRGATLPLYFQRGGTAAAPLTWVGESRDGVVIHGRATFEAGGIVLSNLTFDLTGYSQSGSFNTITVLAGDVTITHVTLTGDCATGLQGGHVEVDGGAGPVTIDSCLVERFGQCAGTGGVGHLDHGIYLASGHDITIVNDEIRENSARGIQLNTEGGAFGTLSRVSILRSRIHHNGHRDYEDGIVLNGSGTGTIDDVLIANDLFYGNYYSGIRFVGDVITNVRVVHDTFFQDGAASSGSGRSEINVDGATPDAHVTGSIFDVEHALVNVCDGTLSIDDDLATGPGLTASCATAIQSVDPAFADAAGGDYHATSAAATGYGAYAP